MKVLQSQKHRFLNYSQINEALQTISALGDDRLTKGYAVPDSFTHGTSEQRKHWFMNGLKSGKVIKCCRDRFRYFLFGFPDFIVDVHPETVSTGRIFR